MMTAPFLGTISWGTTYKKNPDEIKGVPVALEKISWPKSYKFEKNFHNINHHKNIIDHVKYICSHIHCEKTVNECYDNKNSSADFKLCAVDDLFKF